MGGPRLARPETGIAVREPRGQGGRGRQAPSRARAVTRRSWTRGRWDAAAPLLMPPPWSVARPRRVPTRRAPTRRARPSCRARAPRGRVPACPRARVGAALHRRACWHRRPRGPKPNATRAPPSQRNPRSPEASRSLTEVPNSRQERAALRPGSKFVEVESLFWRDRGALRRRYSSGCNGSHRGNFVTTSFPTGHGALP